MTVIADAGDADGSSMAENECRARVGPYGFEWPEDFDHEGHEAFWRGYRAVLARRLRKWERFLSSSSSADRPPPALRRNSAKLKRYVRKGIPREHRKQVWMSLSGAAALQHEQRGLYQSLLQLRRQPELVEAIQIGRHLVGCADVPRTFPDNVYFHGGGQQQASLFNVLVAYAQFNQGVGYCQGLNFVAGLLLLATEDEEATFWLLRALLERLLPDYYGRHMSGLLTDIEVLAQLIRHVEGTPSFSVRPHMLGRSLSRLLEEHRQGADAPGPHAPGQAGRRMGYCDHQVVRLPLRRGAAH
ncbi:growth hormone-regulated TBC protein 1-like isoform X5 [Haemaphysalis longicornis]